MPRTGAFYERLFLETGMTVAWGVVPALNARITRLRAMTIGSVGRREDAAAEMGRLVQALRDRDADAAQAASQDHVRRMAQIAAEARGICHEPFAHQAASGRGASSRSSTMTGNSRTRTPVA